MYSPLMRSRASSFLHKMCPATQDAQRNVSLTILFGILLSTLAWSAATNYGWRAPSAPKVEFAVQSTGIDQQLQAAGIARLSRGYFSLTEKGNYIAVKLAESGEWVEIESNAWRGPNEHLDRRYLLQFEPRLTYRGVSPELTETKAQFLAVIQRDVDLAVGVVQRLRRDRVAATNTWQ